MKTKEAIKYLNGFNIEYVGNRGFNEERKNNLNEVIALLKRGEKFEAIVNDLEKFNDGKVLKVNENEWWKYRVNKIIQKYFPKGGK